MLSVPLRSRGVRIAACALLVLACEPDRGTGTADGGAAVEATEAIAADGEGATPEAPTAWSGNLFANPGFEQGREGWGWREQSANWGNFEITDTPVRSGRKAVHLRLHQGPSLPWRPAKVYGVVQELAPKRFPERLGGWYRVERWEKREPATSLYLQAVVIVFDAKNAGRIARPEQPILNLNNYQLRTYITGLSKPAFLLSNARIRFLSFEQPEPARWVHFEVPVRKSFQESWGMVPEGYDMLRVLVEARWDNLPANGSVYADVYYDDLYLDYGEPSGVMPVSAR